MTEPQTVLATSVAAGPQKKSESRPKKILGPIGACLALIGKFLAKLKYILLPILKFGLPMLKTGGSMLLTIGIYAISWGWQYALGFVLLIFVHECGHLVAARRVGLKVGAPVFIPFMGAFIALKEAPPDAWIEAQVGIGLIMGTMYFGLIGLFVWGMSVTLGQISR